MIVIDLDTKTLKNGKQILIDNGVPINGYVLDNSPITFEQLETLYQNYKHSVPDNIRYKKNYFKALQFEQLSTEDLITGANRQKAKEALELAILTGVLNGSLTWPDDRTWFWQSKTDKDFVILKKWFIT